jgi:ubiquinone/menaquinone biosynthesis C-methylase UbiE
MNSSLDPLVSTIAAYEAGAASYASRSRDRSHLGHLHDRFASSLGNGAPVLDLGCGAGHDAADLTARGLRVVACDPTRGLLRQAGAHPIVGATLVGGDARQLPFVAESFSGIWACASLLHLPKSQVSGALAEARRVLKPSGLLFTSMQRGESDGLMTVGETDSLPGRFYVYYTETEWQALIESAGFGMIEQRVGSSMQGLNAGATGWIETFGRRG